VLSFKFFDNNILNTTLTEIIPLQQTMYFYPPIEQMFLEEVYRCLAVPT